MSEFPFPIFKYLDIDIDGRGKPHRSPADPTATRHSLNPFRAKEAREISENALGEDEGNRECEPSPFSQPLAEHRTTNLPDDFRQEITRVQAGRSSEGTEAKSKQRDMPPAPGPQESAPVHRSGRWVEFHDENFRCERVFVEDPKPDPSFLDFDLDDLLDEAERGQEWVVPGLIARGEAHLLVAKTKVGKTSLVTQVLLCVAMGIPFLGLPIEAGVAIGLLYEDSRKTIGNRLKHLMSDLAIEKGSLKASKNFMLETRDDRKAGARKIWLNGEAKPRFDELKQQIQSRRNVKIVVIDTIKSVFQDKITEGEEVRPFIEAVQDLASELNVAIVFIAHENRKRETAGSVEFDNGFRQILRLQKSGDHCILTAHESNIVAAAPPLALINPANQSWKIRPEVPERPSRAKSLTEKSRDQQLLEVSIDAVDNTPGGLSNSKHARNYAPRFLYARWGKKLKATEADFKALMDELLSGGRIGEKRKGPKHDTMILCVVDTV